jgi:hypothetical protein
MFPLMSSPTRLKHAYDLHGRYQCHASRRSQRVLHSSKWHKTLPRLVPDEVDCTCNTYASHPSDYDHIEKRYAHIPRFAVSTHVHPFGATGVVCRSTIGAAISRLPQPAANAHGQAGYHGLALRTMMLGDFKAHRRSLPDPYVPGREWDRIPWREVLAWDSGSSPHPRPSHRKRRVRHSGDTAFWGHSG